MPYSVTSFQPTPNPNAIKCVLDRSIAEPVRSFRGAQEAENDEIAKALFAVPGVTSVLLAVTWLTVNKSPAGEWAKIRKGVQAALKELP